MPDRTSAPPSRRGSRPVADAARPTAMARSRQRPVPTGGLEQARPTSSTPRRFALLRSLCVALSILFALVTAVVGYHAQAQADAAAQEAAQYGRLTSIQSHLVAAQTQAQNRFLSAGPLGEDPVPAQIASAQDQLVAAAAANPKDAGALRPLAGDISTYAADLSSALAAKQAATPGRAGDSTTPGMDSLERAQTLLDATIQPALTKAASATDARARSHAAGIPLWWIVVPGVLALAPLIVASIILARRTHRVINPGLALAMVFTIGALALAVGSMSSLQSQMRHATGTSATSARALHAARLDGYAARRAEMSHLLTGADTQDEREAAVQATNKDLDDSDQAGGSAQTSWSSYETMSQSGPSGTAVAFQNFLTALDKAVDRDVALTTRSYADATRWLRLACLGVGALALLSAVGSWAGITRRLREYREESAWRR